MKTARRRRRRRPNARFFGLLLATIVVVVVVIALAGGGSSTSAPRRLESMFQDDQMLVYNTSNTSVEQTLQTLKGLGVDRLRITVNWQNVAPDAGALIPPHFDAVQPSAYPPLGWVPYDRIDLLAKKYGLSVDFDVSAPGPLWAAQANAHDVEVAASYGLSGAAFTHVEHDYGLSAAAFGEFVQAVGRRYSGHYQIRVGKQMVTLPRVSFWSIWNEPNQPGWLAPQFQQPAGRWLPAAPELYRDYVDAAAGSLRATGHGKDTLLFGELAPEGCVPGSVGGVCALYPKIDQPLPPVPFVRWMYCLNKSYRPLRGATATAVGCPSSGSRAAFVKDNPALFRASAFSYHPYSLQLAPNLTPQNEPDFVVLANLPRLEDQLDRIFRIYGVQRKLPLYLTEYGYETNPPNPTSKGQTLDHQSMWLNEATYMAAKDPRVEGLSQFLLVDSAPDTQVPSTSPAYWSTFQTGLEFLSGQPKPAFYSYRLPIWLPDGGVVARGRSLPVWAMLRLAPNHTRQRATIQWSSNGEVYRTIARVVTTNPQGIFKTRVRAPGSGYLRVAWISAAGTPYYSRSVTLTEGG